MSTAVETKEKEAKEDKVIVRQVGERVRLTLGIESESTKDTGDGSFETVITTSTLDRQGESITTTGIDTTAYMANPVVLYGHDYQGLPIGKTTKLTAFNNKLKARFQLAVNEYPFAATVAALIKGGYLNAVSIGGMVKQWSDDYRTIEELEMVEFSVVPVPANPEALITARALEDMTGKSVETIEAEFKDFAHKSMLDGLKHMRHDEVNDTIKVLENLVATLKVAAQPSASEEPNEVKRIKHITLRDSAKAVATQSERVIRVIKLKSQED